MRILLIILFLFPTLAYGQVAQLEGTSLPYLNSQLRESVRRMDAVDGLLAAYTVNSWSGILNIDSGGTGLNLGTGEQGSVLYFSATGVMAELKHGVSGQFLETQGDSANPAWATVPESSLLSQVSSSGESQLLANTYSEISAETKTITSGSVVFVIATLSLASTSGNQATLNLKHGTTAIQTIDNIETTDPDHTVCLQGIVTGVSGSITFTLEGKDSGNNTITANDANLTVIEIQ